MISPRSIASSHTVPPPAHATLPHWKRGLDLACVAAALPFLLAVGLVVSLWLWLLSPGPIFFRQERVGINGRRFMLYKFRSMHAGADVASHRAHFTGLIGANRPMQKLDSNHDNRMVPGGWLLRASGLDELPQVINIFLGDMSVVGPRPCIPYEYDHYSPWHRQRLACVPGLTGLWQVSGKNRTTFDEMVRLDIQYGQSRSLWLDLSILSRTLPALWTQISDTRLLRRQRKAAAAEATVANHPTPTFQT